ncbi:bifunctional 5,10-methylene-tetrahydrofolate dehydrogenase/5,10-methylene-tetrahydrofolate cyclohydrolase [Candidatus Uhrbacteria bacterium]|nr:bifunctional 5,10-methylene-tetrahydrofolate dehydrogenase/5,10-methylene-tetrahydrofolate cyclohydrolase [Candidatus Uhrbacteria bacterium]MBD3284236.1 bifunctional 5,10-methylene-tetrahydrofolate dehydrogenase/5,10-methylene-tetrahydrofolate cyclohydrolase [Candidatus Uhrbacteria bacterium]
MKPIDGRALAKQIREQVKAQIEPLQITPKLGVMLVGDDPASHLYVSLKEKAAAEVGILTDVRKLSAEKTDEEIMRVIMEWNDDPEVHGVLVQLPLPEGHDTERIIAEIDPKKDVDGFHPTNIERLMKDASTILSPVHAAVVHLLGATGFDPTHKSATILANSDTFAEPLAHILQKAGMITAMMDPRVLDTELLKSSDVIVSAIGRTKFIGPDLVKPGAVIIDVGITKQEDGKIYGDADQQALETTEGWVSPVPGGVGPMTIALLLKNVTEAAIRSLG